MSDFLHEQMIRKMFEDYGSYESPIERICREVMADRIKQEEDALVYRASVEVGYNINKEELIKALQYDRNQYQKGFEDCVRSMRLEQTEWIPVTERLPEVGHRVIFNMNNDEIYIGTLYKWDNDLKISLEPTGIGYVYSFENVIAWMPLPKPYKEGE